MPLTPSSLSVAEILQTLGAGGQAIYFWTPQGDTLEWNGESTAILAAAGIELPRTGAAWREMLHGKDVARRDAWQSQPGNAEPWVGTYRVGDPDGPLWVEERLVPVKGSGAVPDLYVGSLRDVSKQCGTLEKLVYLARYDELTGHLSRSHMRAVLARRMAEASRDGTEVSFALIGLDNLAGFNSMFGYDVADVLLLRIGEEIVARLVEGDVIGRVGSSKFAVLFEDCPRDRLRERLKDLQDAIREKVVETGAGPVAATISAAGLSLPRDASTTQDAFAVAEDALNQAKSLGTDQVIIHEPDTSLAETRRENIALADDLVAALRENRLRLAYQPIVQAHDTEQIAFHECLLRLIDRSGQIVNAGAFMPFAEKLGLVRLLDRRVLDLAFETLVRNPRIRLSVNVSPQSLRDTRWQQRFEELALRNPQALERLILEMTEATAIDDAQEAARHLDMLRAMGCTVALDDFGAGYTSFQQLRDLSVDIVKIDGSYVRNILDNPADQVFVSALCSIAKHNELMVVAEMVDSDEAAALLASLGVDSFQGFHFGHPEVDPIWMGEEEADSIVDSVAVAGG